jgi:hypothetical protein
MVVPLKWQRVHICVQAIYFAVHSNEKLLEEEETLVKDTIKCLISPQVKKIAR